MAASTAEAVMADDLEALAARLELIEEVTVDLAETLGRGRILAKIHDLRDEVHRRQRERLEDETQRVQYTGRNADDVRGFCAGDASVVEEPNSRVLTVIYRGFEQRLRPGGWVVRDPGSGRVYVSASQPMEAA
jgi:hypothetical protein